MKKVTFTRTLLHPKYWPTWLAMGFWAGLVIVLPLSLSLKLGKLLGSLLYRVAKRRTHIARVNIKKCFPELSEMEQEQLVKANIQQTGIAAFESGATFFWPNWKWKEAKYDIIGREHVDKVRTEGRGVLLLCMHFTPFEICGGISVRDTPISGFYKPHKNPVYEYLQARGRHSNNPDGVLIQRRDMRGLIRALKQGRTMIYLPDQDFGRGASVFAPYFGIETATIKAPHQILKLGNAELIGWTTTRDNKTGRYRIEFSEPLTAELGKGEIEDATFMNAFVEAQIRKAPEQYLWVHRRFKTRPKGEASFYE